LVVLAQTALMIQRLRQARANASENSS
jgi:hypothetical protein